MGTRVSSGRPSSVVYLSIVPYDSDYRTRTRTARVTQASRVTIGIGEQRVSEPYMPLCGLTGAAELTLTNNHEHHTEVRNNFVEITRNSTCRPNLNIKPNEVRKRVLPGDGRSCGC